MVEWRCFCSVSHTLAWQTLFSPLDFIAICLFAPFLLFSVIHDVLYFYLTIFCYSFRFGSEIFLDLHDQMTLTAARSDKMLTRIRNIETALPPIEKIIAGQSGHVHCAYTTGLSAVSQLSFFV